jgi:fructokinase
MCVIGLDASGVPRYDFLGTQGADRQLAREVLQRIPAEARALHVGSYAMVVPPVADTQRALVEREHGRLLVSYDPNVRPTVEPDLERWRAALEWMLPRTHLIKLSAEDLELLFPGAAADDLVPAWLRRGVRVVVLTRGGEGAVGWHASGQVEVPPVATQVLDTVGAGDTFQAALLTGLAERGRLSIDALAALTLPELHSLMRFAAEAAAITCSRRGADLPYRRELPAAG